MADAGRDPREDVAASVGIGGYGQDFSPHDRDFQATRMKARSVLEGRAHFTFAELEKLVARILVGR